MKVIKIKRAQISSQIFVYVLAAVIVGLILIFGYRAISTVMGAANQASMEGFKSDITYEIESISKTYGSRRKFEFSLPQRFDEICFLDSMNNGRFSISPGIIDNFYIRLSVEENAEYNIFLLKEGEVEEKFYVDDLDVDKNYACFENAGLIEIWLEGLGDTACMTGETGTCL